MIIMRQTEQAKYEKVWTHDRYRQNAPGEKRVAHAIKALGMPIGSSVIDFGCGTGRPAFALQKLGFTVIAVDHAANCLDTQVKGMLNFCQHCLWELPDDLTAEYGFCTDVMEHIPPDYVELTLASIRKAVGAVYFQISTRPDGLGKPLIGEPLHLTVQNKDWWEEQLRLHWVDVDLTGDRDVIAICR